MPDQTVQQPSTGGRHRKPEWPEDPDQTQRLPELQQLIDQFVDPEGGK